MNDYDEDNDDDEDDDDEDDDDDDDDLKESRDWTNLRGQKQIHSFHSL